MPSILLILLALLPSSRAAVCVLTAKIDSANSPVVLTGAIRGIINGGVEQDAAAALVGGMYVVFPGGRPEVTVWALAARCRRCAGGHSMF
jgi:hypothetical protein